MSDWRSFRLGEVADVYDGPHATPTKTDQGPWYLSISSLNNGRFDLSLSAHLSEEDYGIWRRRVTPQPGDTLFSYETRVGSVAHWPYEFPATLGRRMGLLRPHREAIDPRFLTYAYMGPQFQEVLRANTVHGATVERLLIAQMPKWEMLIPSLAEQRRIAGVLGAFDDLIDKNHMLAERLDALSRVVVQDALDQAEESRPLSSYAEFVNGRNFTKGADGAGRPVIRTPEVRLGPFPSTVRTSVYAADGNIARRGDTLFVWSGSLTMGRWRWEDGVINQHVFKVIPREGVPMWLAYHLIERQMQWFLSLAADKATTMGHIQRRHLDGPVPALNRATVDHLDGVVRPMWEASLDSLSEADQLGRVRDELLPLLMSGRVAVDDAWEAVS